MRLSTITVYAMSITSVLATVAGAHGEDADYGLAIIDGRVAVGIGDHGSQQVTDFGERVFAAEMSPGIASWFADEPGIFIEPSSLPDNTQVSFTLTGALGYWDGTGDVGFTTADHVMSISFGPASVSTVFDASPVQGFSINYDADQPGGFDEHFEYSIDPGAASGIYLLANTFSLSGASDSVVIYTVFNAGLDEGMHEAAIGYVESTLVPAPGVLGLCSFAAVGVLGGRRRR